MSWRRSEIQKCVFWCGEANNVHTSKTWNGRVRISAPYCGDFLKSLPDSFTLVTISFLYMWNARHLASISLELVICRYSLGLTLYSSFFLRNAFLLLLMVTMCFCGGKILWTLAHYLCCILTDGPESWTRGMFREDIISLISLFLVMSPI